MGMFDFFGGGGSKSESNSGFLGHDKEVASKTGVYGAQNLLDRAKDQLNSPIPQFSMSSTMPGLFREQEGAAQAFANKMFANASAGGALRGQFSPNNTPGIVGSAITNMGGTLLPLISNNLQTAAMVPEQIFAQRMNNAISPLQALISGLGSTYSGRQTAPGLGYTGANYLMQGLFGGGGEKPTGAQAGLGAIFGG